MFGLGWLAQAGLRRASFAPPAPPSYELAYYGVTGFDGGAVTPAAAAAAAAAEEGTGGERGGVSTSLALAAVPPRAPPPLPPPPNGALALALDFSDGSRRQVTHHLV